MKKTKTALITTILLAVFSLFPPGLFAQSKVNELSLKEAQEYAVKNHYLVKNSQTDVLIARKQVKEIMATGLPQVNGSVQYQYFPDIPTTLLPDFISPAIYAVNENNFGLIPTVPQGETKFFPAKFGTSQNASFGATLSQLIFSGQYIIGLQATRAFEDLADENLEKTIIDVRHNVSMSYMALAITMENRRLLTKGRELIAKTLFETTEQYKNGFVEDLVVDQLQLNLTNLDNTINALNRQVEVSDKLLKFQIGLNITDSIILKDSIGSLLQTIKLDPVVANDFKLANHIDYQLLQTAEKMKMLNLKNEKSAYLPTIAGFATYTKKAMTESFDNFGKASTEWYPTSLIGVTMDIPIFSSGMRAARVQQARMNLEKASTTKLYMGQALEIQAELARTTFNTSLENYKKENDNLNLAGNIYKKTSEKFTQGLSTSTDLTQAYNQYLTIQTSYYQSIFNLLNARINLDKALSKY